MVIFCIGVNTLSESAIFYADDVLHLSAFCCMFASDYPKNGREDNYPIVLNAVVI